MHLFGAFELDIQPGTPDNPASVRIALLHYTWSEDGRLLITDATVLPEKEKVTFLSVNNPSVDYILYPSKQGWKTQTVSVEPVTPKVEWKKVGGQRITVRPEQPALPQVICSPRGSAPSCPLRLWWPC